MSTNRPFLSNFFAAFRAHSAIQKAATTSPGVTGASTPTSYNTTLQPSTSSSMSPNASSAPRTITTKAGNAATGPTTAAVQAATAQFQPTRQHTPSSYSRSPASPGSPGFARSGPSHKQRRGSDSSSDGFREVTDKWYIGGRTATGEERFYRLGMVKRQRSVDRLSLDRLSI